MPTATDVLEPAPSVAREAGTVLVVLVIATLLTYGWSLGFHLDNVHNGLLGGSFAAVGLYVVRMRPGHREGWLLVATGVSHTGMFFARQYGLHEGALPGAPWVGWLGVWPLPLVIAVAGWTLMAFPDGRLLSHRWRAGVAAMFCVAVVLAVISALWPVEYDRLGLAAPHPLRVPGAEVAAGLWQYAQPSSYLAFELLWTVAIVVRMRRARDDELRQMRWLVYAVIMAVLLLIGGLLLLGTPVPGLLALPLIPVAAGFAILKLRLYDIDPVLNRSLVVGAMLLLITTAYVGVVVGVGALVPAGNGPLSVITTAAVAVAFEPLRRRAQRLADRIVYGLRSTPYEALSRLSAQLADAPPELLDAVAGTVATGVGAVRVVVWVGTEDRLLPRAWWPARGAEDTAQALADLRAPGWHVRPVVHRGRVCGAITLCKPRGEPVTSTQDRLLADLAAQTGLVIVQQHQAQELQASARRIVAAEDAARRRIERDLHDGAQQQLVTLGLELGALAEQAKTSGNHAIADSVGSARARLLEATADLRELARGLHPMVLVQSGLQPALEALAVRSPVPVRLRVDLPGTLPADAEATAYYLVSEALTNAARHADASLVEVTVSAAGGGGVRVEVVDDGRGGACMAAGTGLQGLADRLAAHGAELHLDNRPSGNGTRIWTVLPCR